MVKRHAPQNPPSEAALPVQLQIRATSGFEQEENLLKYVSRSRERFYDVRA